MQAREEAGLAKFNRIFHSGSTWAVSTWPRVTMTTLPTLVQVPCIHSADVMCSMYVLSTDHDVMPCEIFLLLVNTIVNESKFLPVACLAHVWVVVLFYERCLLHSQKHRTCDLLKIMSQDTSCFHLSALTVSSHHVQVHECESTCTSMVLENRMSVLYYILFR